MAKGARTTGHGGAITLTNSKIGYQAPRRSPDTRVADLRRWQSGPPVDDQDYLTKYLLKIQRV